MKIVMKLAMAALAAFALGFVLVGCGGGEKEAYMAKYTVISMELPDYNMTLEGDELDQALSSIGGIKEHYVDITDSKNLILKIGDVRAPMTYTKDGDTLTAKDASGTVVLKLNGDEISFTSPAEMLDAGDPIYTMTFKKDQ